MAQRTKAKTNEAANEMHHNMRHASEAARETYDRATRTGRKMQEQASSWWKSMMDTADWQKQAESFVQIAASAVPLAQRNMEQFMHLIERNGRTTTELMKKAAEAVQAPLTGESQEAWMQFWTSTTKAAQTNAEGLMEFGSSAIDSWVEFIRKVAEATPEPTRATA